MFHSPLIFKPEDKMFEKQIRICIAWYTLIYFVPKEVSSIMFNLIWSLNAMFLLISFYFPDDNMNSKIANSIIACNEPKKASALLIKKYVIEYHPDFKVADKPNLFKRALERAINKNQLR